MDNLRRKMLKKRKEINQEIKGIKIKTKIKIK